MTASLQSVLDGSTEADDLSGELPPGATISDGSSAPDTEDAPPRHPWAVSRGRLGLGSSMCRMQSDLFTMMTLARITEERECPAERDARQSDGETAGVQGRLQQGDSCSGGTCKLVKPALAATRQQRSPRRQTPRRQSDGGTADSWEAAEAGAAPKTASLVRNPTPYRGISLIRNRLLLGPYSSPVPRGLGWSWGGARFLMSEVPLYTLNPTPYPPSPKP